MYNLHLVLQFSRSVLAINVVGPDGYFIFWFILLLLAPLAAYLLFRRRGTTGKKQPFIRRKRLDITLEKDRLYYPDFLKLTIKNTGNVDIDLDQPLLIFRSFWMKRKFKLKGTNRYHFYPLYLEAGKSHDLTIDLNHFYRHDKRLKRFARVTIEISEVKGKKFPPRSIMLRKTLFR